MPTPEQYKSGALYVRSTDGPVKWVAGDEYTIKVNSKETNGSLGFVHATVPPGNGPVAHLHESHDEAFYLLEGELEFLDGESTFVASAGDFVFVPRGVRHRFKNISDREARMAFFFTPGGPEHFFLDFGDDPLPGHSPRLWKPEDFTPEMIAATQEAGDIILPE